MVEEKPSAEVEARLIKAIHNKTLAGEARLMLDHADVLSKEDQHLLETALATCDEIREACLLEGDKLARKLCNMDIPCRFNSVEVGNPQIHQVRIDIDSDNPSKAITVAEQQGYRRLGVSGGAEWQVYRRRMDRVVLTMVDDDSRRLELRWQGRKLGFLKFFWPVPDDARLLPIPGSLWPLAFVLRPFGILLRMMGRQHGSSSVGCYLGTPMQLIPELLKFAEVTSDDVLIDLGCGDGRVLIEAAHQIGCRGVGFERNTHLCQLARESSVQRGVTGLVMFHCNDVSMASIEDASVVFLFLPPKKVAEMVPQLLARLPRNGRVVAHEILPIKGASPQSKLQPLFSESGLTVAHLWCPEGDAV